MDRSDALATIDNALLEQQTPAAPKTEPSPVQPHAAPPLPGDEGTKLTAEQKKTLKNQREIEAAQEDLLGKEQADALKEEERLQKERESLLLDTAQKVWNSTKKGGQAAGDKVVSLPTPGSIGFPLMVLILFFFILVQFGGHTRFQWIWLVLTGNAHVGTSQNGGGTGGGGPPGADTQASSQTPQPPEQPSLQDQPLGTFPLDLRAYTSVSKGGMVGAF